MRLGILETLQAQARETLYPSRSLTAGSGNSDTAGAAADPRPIVQFYRQECMA